MTKKYIFLKLTALALALSCLVAHTSCDAAQTSGGGGFSSEVSGGKVIISSNAAVSPHAPKSRLVFGKSGGKLVLESVSEGLTLDDYSIAQSSFLSFTINGKSTKIAAKLFNEDGKSQGEAPLNFVADYIVFTATPAAPVEGEVVVEYVYKRLISASPAKVEDTTVRYTVSLSRFEKDFNRI